MRERNICKDSGCAGFCCQDIYLEITQNERSRLFKKATLVASLEQIIEYKKSQLQGTFYLGDYGRDGLNCDGMCLLLINGPCPNRTTEGDCSQHEEREHAARNFKIGCGDCNAIRKEHGLAPIFFEPVE